MITLKNGLMSALISSLIFGTDVICFPAQVSDIVWLEAECFETTGGWVNDPQFVDVMGSAYLLANGVDEPVEDAFTRVEIRRGGTYRLWVRCKDWLPGHSPGQFEVWIEGEASPMTFGKSDSDQWQWVDGGQFALKRGGMQVRLHDLTGWWGRCDAVALSKDDNFRPANDVYFLEIQRKKYFEPYRHVEETKSCDVVVVGGGLAGSAAAVAAARHGCSVVLIQDRPVLGGNASSEIDVPPGGDESHEPFDPGETGIIEEFYSRSDRGFDHDWSLAIERVVRTEPNIDLRMNTRAINVLMEDAHTIEAVLALDVRTGKRLLFPGKMFIDCTGDGWIGFWAGAIFRKGREARSEFNESLAPEKADLKTMGNTLMVAKFRDGEPARFVCPEWAYTHWKSPEDFEVSGTHFALKQVLYPIEASKDEFSTRFTHGSGFHAKQYVPPEAGSETEVVEFRTMPVTADHYKDFRLGRGYRPSGRDGGFFQWWVELGGTMDTIYDAEQIRDELFRINLGLWNYVKNYDPEFKQQNKNRNLTWINYVPGKRESRRLIGDYILTQWDYADEIVHEDNVAYGGWGIDIHHPNGFWKSGPMYYNAYRGRKVSVPFQCLYSQNISNLLMAGRNISVSHVALGGVRVMRTTCLMGQAVGTAAALCVQKEALPRVLRERHVRELQQQLMKDGVYVMGQKNEDPADLALQAAVTASSVKTMQDPKWMFPDPKTPLIHDLNTPRAVMFKPRTSRIHRIGLFLRSSNQVPTPVVLTLRAAQEFADFSSQIDLAEATTSVPPKSQAWVIFELDCAVDPEKYYYVFLPAVKGIQWDLFPTLVRDACRAYGGPNWTSRQECYAFTLTPDDVKPIVVPTVKLNPENVIDGFNRAVDGVPHSWGPDPAGPLPQWFELKFKKPEFFNTVHVTFQSTELSCPNYRIMVAQGNAWKTVAEAEKNETRHNIHSFPLVKSNRVRLLLDAPALANKEDSAQVCEIRVYKEPAGSR